MLFRKMLRDLKGNLTQFVSIFLMTFMGIFIFTGLNAIGSGMDQCSKDFYKETNLASAILYGENFSKEEALQIEQLDRIRKVERKLQLEVGMQDDVKTTIQLNVVESNQISGNYLIEGETFDVKISGIWLDSAFAEKNSIKVGDTLTLIVQGETVSKIVKGLIMNPEYVYALKDENEVMPDHKNYGYAFLSANEYWQESEVPFNELLLETSLDQSKLESILADVLGENSGVLVMQKDFASVAMFENEVNQMKAVQKIFPIIFLFIAILTTLTTMTRITVNQRIQIGVLKALGFSNRKILWHYMTYGVFIGTVGGVLGLIMGPALLPNVTFSFQKGFYTMPVWKGFMEPIVFVIVVGCIVCCGLSGYFACRKELLGVAAQILRPKAPKMISHSRIEKSRWWNRIGFDVQWNIRDLMRNKVRTLITLTGIVGCMTLILCAFGMRDTIQEITNTSYKELNTYATKVSLSESISTERLLELRGNEELQFVQETAIEVASNEVSTKEVASNELSTNEVTAKKESTIEVASDKVLANEVSAVEDKKTTMLTIIGDGELIKQKNRTNNYVDLPKSGVAITNKFAKLGNYKVGDMLKWRIYGTKEWISCKIVQILKSPVNQGVYLSEEAYNEAGFEMIPSAFVSNEPQSNYSQEDFSSVQSKEDLLNMMNTLLESMNVMIVIFIIGATTLGIVVLYNLGVLSFHEKIRELATLKVLGFQYGKLRKLLQMQNIWITLLGILLGVPAGYGLLSFMLNYMGDSFDMEPMIYLRSYVISILGTLVLSILVNLVLSRKLKSIDMVSALKSVE